MENIENPDYRNNNNIVSCENELNESKLIKSAVETLVNLIEDFSNAMEEVNDGTLTRCIIMELEEMKEISELIRARDRENEAVYAFVDSLYNTYASRMESKFDAPDFDDLYKEVNEKLETMISKGKINFGRNLEFAKNIKEKLKLVSYEEKLKKYKK